MLSYKAKDARAAFSKFNLREVKCKHHIKGYFEVDGVVYFQLYYSFGSKDIPKFVVEKLARACGLSRGEFVEFSKCRISIDEYFVIAKKRGVID